MTEDFSEEQQFLAILNDITSDWLSDEPKSWLVRIFTNIREGVLYEYIKIYFKNSRLKGNIFAVTNRDKIEEGKTSMRELIKFELGDGIRSASPTIFIDVWSRDSPTCGHVKFWPLIIKKPIKHFSLPAASRDRTIASRQAWGLPMDVHGSGSVQPWFIQAQPVRNMDFEYITNFYAFGSGDNFVGGNYGSALHCSSQEAFDEFTTLYPCQVFTLGRGVDPVNIGIDTWEWNTEAEHVLEGWRKKHEEMRNSFRGNKLTLHEKDYACFTKKDEEEK